MLAREQAEVDRTRAVSKLKKAQKRAAQTGTERKQKHAANKRAITRRQCADPKRRRRMEKDTAKWLMYYMRAAFPFPWSEGHRAIIHNSEHAAATGTGTTVAAPRGEGKTTVLRGVAINLVARGIVRFPVLAGWKHNDAAAAYKMWLRMLCDSPEFQADYPEITQPFEISTHATALKLLTWADTGKRIGAQVDTMLKQVVLPDSLGAVAARSVQGDVKGLNVTLADGTVLRPDLLLLDDAQNPKQAANPKTVEKTVDTIENELMGLAGPRKRLTTFCACTVEAESDVSEHFLSRPGWTSIRVSRITTWPGGGYGGDWPLKPDDPQRELWDDWNRIRLGPDDGEIKAVRWYKKHKAALTKCMRVSWKHRFDDKRGEPDAKYSAMRDFYDKGADVFARAQQNLPLARGANLYELTPAVVQSRADQDRLPGVVPDWAQTVIATTDVNPSYALTSAVIAFGANQRAAVLWYGLYTGAPLPVHKEDTEAQTRQQIYKALAVHGRELAALPCMPNHWIIDGGGSPEGTVIDLAHNAPKICSLQASCAFGRGWRNYRPTARAKYRVIAGEQAHRVVERRDRQWIIFNADYWREVAQRAWTGEPGAPGSCSLPSGRHPDFADQLCRELLRGKDDIAGRTVWIWETHPGPHDYGDCMTMAFAGAALAGIGTGRQAPAPLKRREYKVKGMRHVKV